ncbi:hypothetical protein OZX60_03200 [Streptococcaceae bacterium ESL0687]|nr:hypothetical protein OZX60_03200 [Streptococcaceae bacterium ESL0687]
MAKSQLIKDIVTDKITLEEGLQRLLIISFSLENESLQNWIKNELNGYPDNKKLPNYRKKIAYKISYTGINGSYQVTNIPLPASYIPNELQKYIVEVGILDNIKTIEEIIRTNAKVGRDLTNIAGSVYNKVGVVCLSITQEYSISSFLTIISNVKNKLIFVLNDLEKTFGNLDSLDIDLEKVDTPEIETINEVIKKRIHYDGMSEER